MQLNLGSLDVWQLLWCSCISALLWQLFYALVGDRAVLWLFPRDLVKYINEEKKKDSTFASMCDVAGVSIVHSAAVSPVAMYCVFLDPITTGDRIHGRSPIYIGMCIVLLGYFIWDAVICVRNFKSYGPTFLVHALVSFAILFAQSGTIRYTMCWNMVAAAASECSTPFMHARWFFIKAKMVDRKEFRILNSLFTVLFCVVRLFLIEYYVIYPFIYESFVSTIATVGMPLWRRSLLLFCSVAWAVLQYAWGVPFIKKQSQLLLGGSKKEQKGE